jgi:hypothetical protein
MMQPIDSHGKTGEDFVTNKVAADLPVSPNKSIDYAIHALPVAESSCVDSSGFDIEFFFV